MKLMVGDAARIADVAPDTIRFWHRRGWLRAERTASGVRLFERVDVERVADERRRLRRVTKEA